MTTDPQGERPANVDRAHPHGLFGYVVEDLDRTRNLVRLLRWTVSGAVAVIGVLAVVFVILLQSQWLAGLIGGLSTVTAGSAAWCARRRRRTR